MSHYYKTDTTLSNKEIKVKLTYRDQDFLFFSNNGIFSKDEIDKGSLILLDYLMTREINGKLLDVGCGYGLLGIVIKRFFPETAVTMIDVNQRAVNQSVINCEINRTECKVVFSDIYSAITSSYTFIISNPPIRAGKKTVRKIIAEAKDNLEENGELIMVIRRNQGALSYLKYMNEKFKNGETVKRSKGYYVLRAQNIAD